MNLGWWGCGLCGGSVSHAFCCGKDKVWWGVINNCLLIQPLPFHFFQLDLLPKPSEWNWKLCKSVQEIKRNKQEID